jgi:hypothetical protein
MSDLLCHVHVGMPKTGTTSIQNTLSTVQDQPTRYLPLKGANHSLIFANLFEAKPWLHPRHVYMGHTQEHVLGIRKRLEKTLRKLLEEAEQDQFVRAVVFSGERLGNAKAADLEAMRKFHSFFAPYCSDFRIYGYIRPLADFIASAFQQRIKVWGNPDIDERVIFPRYRSNFEKFDILFGRSNVSLRRFARADLLEGDVVRDLASQIGMDLSGHSTQHSNESYSVEAVSLLFAIRRSEYVPDKLRDVAVAEWSVSNILSKIKGGKLAFDPSFALRYADKNRADIDWIENRIGASVTDIAPSSVERPIRNNQDFLEIAAESIKLLDDLEDDPVFLSTEFTLTDMKRWVQQGLKTGQSI